MAGPTTTTPFAWYRADKAFTDAGKTTPCSVNGVDTCYTLEDQSGNGRDLVQSSSGSRPTYYSTSGAGGTPCLRFDGSNDEIGLSSLSQAQPLSIFLVFKSISWQLNDDIINFDSTGNGLRIQQYSATPRLSLSAGTTLVESPSGTPTLGVFHLVTGIINGSSSRLQIDNDAEQSGGSGTASLSKIYIGSYGGGQWSNIDLCEAIVYSAVLTSAEQLEVRRYLNAKYSLGLTLTAAPVYQRRTHRRSSGMVNPFPTDTTVPTSNLVGWWNASNAYSDAGTTLITSDATTCQQLTDLTPSGTRQLTQGTSGNRPTWYSNQLNGWPCLRFDGSNDDLSVTWTQAQPLTIYLVAKQITWTDGDSLIQSSQASDNITIRQRAGSSPDINIYATSWGTAVSPALSSAFLLQAVFNGASSFMKLNGGSDVSESGIGSTGIATDFTLMGNGAGRACNCDFFELLVYSEAHTSSTGSGLAVRSYLNSKYQLGISGL